MGKQILVREIMINQQATMQSPAVVNLDQKIVSLSITCMDVSVQRLFVGWNENPSSKNYFNPGDSKPYGPFREGDYLTGNILRLSWETFGATNAALVSIQYETDEEVC